jgi:hypothetical protein
LELYTITVIPFPLPVVRRNANLEGALVALADATAPGF